MNEVKLDAQETLDLQAQPVSKDLRDKPVSQAPRERGDQLDSKETAVNQVCLAPLDKTDAQALTEAEVSLERGVFQAQLVSQVVTVNQERPESVAPRDRRETRARRAHRARPDEPDRQDLTGSQEAQDQEDNQVTLSFTTDVTL